MASSREGFGFTAGGAHDDRLSSIATRLHEAQQQKTVLDPLIDTWPDLDIDTAYKIQQQVSDLRMQGSGVRVIGRKIGLTSKPVQQMLKVGQPDFGVLFSDMAYSSGSTVKRDTLIQPKIEGEIAFVLKRDLVGPGITAADVLTATEGVMACFEIVDSRIRDWKISIADTIADNASSGLFVLGDRLVDPRSVDLSLCGLVLEKNGEVAVTGAGAAVLGSPVNAVVWLANELGRLGVTLRAGEVILSGALAAMVVVEAGDKFRLSIGGIGSCSVNFA
ncbi:MAG: fumarylacetoacetate hydrolase family protein [Janthinobacterium lividum]